MAHIIFIKVNMSIKYILLALFWQLAFDTVLFGQEAFILTQEREGTASVYLSEDNKKAFIVDGGKKGGLTKPRLDGKPVLQGLLDRGYKHLVITCSHPHDDHAGGLKEIIKSDPHLTKFTSISFVDSGYPENESLVELFKRSHPDFPANQISHASALGKDAFQGMTEQGNGVRVNNFIYEPAAGAKQHGHSVITQTVLEKNGKKTVIVDFDDADSDLVKRWADWASIEPTKRRPNVVIAPHHSSDLTDIRPLLKDTIRPDSCVITVNPRNRFLHPGASNLKLWVDAVGLENIHITGVSENVKVTEAGISPISDSLRLQATYDNIIQPNLNAIEKRMVQFEEKSLANTLTDSERKTYDNLKNQYQALTIVKEQYLGRTAPNQSAIISKLPEPIKFAPNNEIANDFPQLKEALDQSIASSAGNIPLPGGVGGTSGGSRSKIRASRFDFSIKSRPIFGGVILGNSTSSNSLKVVRAHIGVITNSENSTIEITPFIAIVALRGEIREILHYEDMTMTELWSAYNFVSPSAIMRTQYGVDETECSLVGKSGDITNQTNIKGWTFGIHPAIENTIIGLDGMRLDMYIATAKPDLFDEGMPDFTTYQWYDEMALINGGNGKITVKAISEPEDLLMRVRFWKVEFPAWAITSMSIEDALIEELGRRWQSKHQRSPTDKDKEEINEIALELAKEFRNEPVPVRLNMAVVKMHQRFDGLRRIERFAKLVAIMNWIADADKLPPLPEIVKKTPIPISNKLLFKDVAP